MLTTVQALVWSGILTFLMFMVASALCAKAWTPPGAQIAFGNRENLPMPLGAAGRADRAARSARPARPSGIGSPSRLPNAICAPGGVQALAQIPLATSSIKNVRIPDQTKA